jgi:uncharacterized protein YciI
MKHFLVEITYLFPIEIVAETTPEHRAFLQTGYDAGKLLLSGPQVPKVGGIVLARAESLEEIQQFFHDDPYVKKGLASYRFVEFNPVMFQKFMQDWL